MNKLFTKIAGLSLGLAMAIGVGVAVGSKEAIPVRADTSSDSAEPGSGGKFSEAGWSNSGLGSKYADGSAKFDSSGDNIYKTDLFSGTVSSNMTSLQVDVQYKINGTGAAANAVTIAPYVNSSYSTGTTQTGFSSTSKTTKSVTVSSGLAGCTGFKLTYTKSSGNLSVYKITWTATYTGVTKYTVTFNSNGGSSSPDQQQIESGKTFTFPSPGTKTGYVFDGWSSNGGTNKYATGATSPAVTAAINYTAYWHEDPVATVTVSAGSFAKSYYTTGTWDWEHLTVTYTTEGGAGGTATGLTKSNFTFSPASPNSTSITSVSVTATYGGVTSASINITGITVTEKQNLGGIVDGEKYFLIVGGHVLKSGNEFTNSTINTYTTSDSSTSSLTENDAWLFTAAGADDTWYITFGSTSYLGTNNSNSGMVANSTQTSWTVEEGTGTYSGKLVMKNTTYSRYISFTNNSSWIRAYGNLNNGDCEVSFVKYVAPASIETVEFTGDMSKKEYYVGDSWDYSGIKLQANKSDETSEDLGAIAALVTAGDLEIEASPSAPGTGVTSVTISGIYGEDLLEAEITITGITVSTPRSITGVAITGDMTNKSYTAGDSWDYSGLNMTVTYDQGQPDVVALTTAVTAGDIEFTPNPATATTGTTSLTLGSITHISFEGEISDKVITGITVSAVPGRINFGTTSGYWNPTASGATTTDNLGSSVEITSNSGAAYSQQGSDYKQIGTNNNAATEVIITIDLTERSGIDALSIKYEGAASRSNHTVLVYGDTTSDVILNGSISGTTNHEQSTGQEYTKINADYIHVKFTGNVTDCGGVKVFYIQYTLGSTVQEFGTLKTIEIDSSSQHETVFKLNQTFSSNGLVLLATDTTGFTKLINEGFTTSKDGVQLTTEAEGIEVVVTLTLKGVTKTCSYTIDVINPPVYTLASTLYEGQKVLIGATYNSVTYVAGALSGKYLESVTATLDGSTIEFNADALEFTIEFYGFNILLRNGSNYLKCNGDRDITFTPTLADDCVWSFDGSSLTPVAHSGYEMRYNGGSPRFTTYSTGGQTAIGLYVSSATPKDAAMGAATFAQQYLHMRDYNDADGSCKNDSANHYYSTAKAFYTSASFSSDEKVEFAKLSDAVARLQAWARANGETFDPSAKTFSAINGRAVLSAVTKNSGTAIAIIAISAVSLVAIGGYFLFRKKKEN